MRWPQLSDPILGTLYRGWGTWKGHAFVTADNWEIELLIKIRRRANADPFLSRLRHLVENFAQFMQEFARLSLQRRGSAIFPLRRRLRGFGFSKSSRNDSSTSLDALLPLPFRSSSRMRSSSH